MKKNHTMRAASLLLVLTLITSCFVGGTFAKYTTKIAGSDTARVAKFGVELTADANLFGPQYTDATNGITVYSDSADEDVIAPGTEGSATFFTIAGAPEVDVNFKITLNGKDDGTENYTIATLPKATATYKDYTDVTTDKTFDLAADYQPVVWTLTKNGTEVATGNLDKIEAYFDGISKVYHAEEAAATGFESINGDYVLSWVWGFEVNDQADTYMGQIAAGVVTPAPAGYVGNESFKLLITADQVD